MINETEISALAEIKQGILRIIKRREFDNCVKVAPDGKYFIKLTKIYRKRSVNQNSYMWGVVVPMVRDGLIDLGWDITLGDTHEILKKRFLKKEIINKETGEQNEIVQSTTELKTIEFMDYIAKIQQWSAEELSINIPNPNE